MPEGNSPASGVLDALGYALFLQDESGALRLAGVPPEWLAGLCRGDALAADASPFLENFLIDARECWSTGGRIESGPWIEQGGLQLQATALTAGGRACLLVERLGAAFAASVDVLQKARETVIALQRLDAEIQKKEILVHCLAEDLSAAVGNVVTSLRLIELEENTPKTAQLLALALRGAQAQRQLINNVLDLFSDELGGLYGRAGGVAADADLHRVLLLAVEDVMPQFTEKGVRLTLPDAGAAGVSAEAERFARVVANLLRHALEHTPAGGEVAVRISEEGDAALLAVEHPGDAADPSRAQSPAALLRLQFCRIALASCQAEMGFTPREGGGTCAWVRLPKSGGTR